MACIYKVFGYSIVHQSRQGFGKMVFKIEESGICNKLSWLEFAMFGHTK